MSDLPSLDELYETFELLDDWEDRYAFLIDLGKKVPALEESCHTDEYKVQGCVSNLWVRRLPSTQTDNGWQFEAASDAIIVRGLVAIALILFNHKTIEEMQQVDVKDVFDTLSLSSHLSPSRSNGFFHMIERMKAPA